MKASPRTKATERARRLKQNSKESENASGSDLESGEHQGSHAAASNVTFASSEMSGESTSRLGESTGHLADREDTSVSKTNSQKGRRRTRPRSTVIPEIIQSVLPHFGPRYGQRVPHSFYSNSFEKQKHLLFMITSS